jgi:ParB family chromosome partitioning protein
MNNKRKLIFANNPLLSGPAFGERDKLASPYRVIDLNSIEADASQPRQEFDPEKLEELAQSIKTYGVLNPILIKPASAAGKFVILAGERRYRACKKLGLTSIPAIIDQGDGEDKDRTLAIQLVENLQRADLTPLEKAQAISNLKDTFGLSVRDIAEKLGVSKSMVQRSLDLLGLPDDLLNALREGASESKVLLLAKIDDPEIRATYLRDIDSLTRDDLQKRIPKTKSKVVSMNLGLDDQRIIEELQRSLGLKVRMRRDRQNPEAGVLELDFYSSGDLQEIFRRVVGATDSF